MSTSPKLDYSKISDVEIDGIDMRDTPDFCDAHVTRFTYGDREATEEEVDELNDDHSYVYDRVLERLY